jgi:aryl-alcohol dehydrogenase-like predicted oxidoreductase
MQMRDPNTRDRRSRLVFGTVDLPDTPIAPRLLDRFYDAGCRLVDTANVYRGGESARAVGKWLNGGTSREGIVVYGKGCHPPFCSPDVVPAEVDEARRLLGVDRIDVFILHRDDTTVPVSAFADALLDQVALERIGAFGVSNWTPARLRELDDYVSGIGESGLVTLSNHFSLAEMVFPPWPGCLGLTRREVLELEDLGIDFLAWSSIATWFFAGRDIPGWDTDANRARRDRASELAAQRRTSTSAVALAYVLHQPEFVLAAVGTGSEAHLDEALASAALELTADELAWLEAGVPA